MMAKCIWNKATDSFTIGSTVADSTESEKWTCKALKAIWSLGD